MGAAKIFTYTYIIPIGIFVITKLFLRSSVYFQIKMEKYIYYIRYTRKREISADLNNLALLIKKIENLEREQETETQLMKIEDVGTQTV